MDGVKWTKGDDYTPKTSTYDLPTFGISKTSNSDVHLNAIHVYSSEDDRDMILELLSSGQKYFNYPIRLDNNIIRWTADMDKKFILGKLENRIIAKIKFSDNIIKPYSITGLGYIDIQQNTITECMDLINQALLELIQLFIKTNIEFINPPNYSFVQI
jgi:hypothetical protein